MPSEVETMFSANIPAWHRLGVVTKGALTSTEAIEKAGLDWTVTLNPLLNTSLYSFQIAKILIVATGA